MGKSILTIHKELEKEAYEKTPLGQLEKKLRKFYREMESDKKRLPEPIAKEIYEIRDAHEKAQMAFIEKHQREAKEEADRMLFESMTKEMTIIENYQGTAETVE